MTVQSTSNRVDHVANGVQTAFTYDYLLLDAAHMTVFLDGVATPTGWTVDGVGDPNGGLVTFDSPPSDQVAVTLLRVVPLTQEVDYVENDRFPAETHEAALDLAVMRDQQAAEEGDRSLKYGIDTQLGPDETVLPEPEPSKAIGYDINGKLANVVIGTGGSPVVNPLAEDLRSGGNSFIAEDEPGGIALAVMGPDGVVEGTEFTRQGQNLDDRYDAKGTAGAVQVNLNLHVAEEDIHFADITEDDIQYVRKSTGGVPGWEEVVVPPGTQVGDTPPPNPDAGAQWWSSVSGRLYTWYVDSSGGQWVESGPAPFGVSEGNGEPGSGGTVVAGQGLTGGGDITLNPVLNVGEGAGIAVSADNVAVDATVQRRIAGGANGNLVSRNASGDVQDAGVSAGDFEVAGAVADHEGAPDPHPQYLTGSEGDASYAPLSHVGATGPAHGAFTPSDAGFAPPSGGGTTTFLRADGAWATPPGSGGFAFSETYSWAIGGVVENDVYPGTFALLGAGETLTTVRFRRWAEAGSGNVQFYRNGSPIGSAVPVGQTPTDTALVQALDDGDRIELAVTGGSGLVNLMVTLEMTRSK